MQDLEARLMELVRETKKGAHSYQSDLGAFRSLVRCVKEGGEDRELSEVLALAAEKGLDEHVALLLRRGAGPNSPQQPLLELLDCHVLHAFDLYHSSIQLPMFLVLLN